MPKRLVMPMRKPPRGKGFSLGQMLRATYAGVESCSCNLPLAQAKCGDCLKFLMSARGISVHADRWRYKGERERERWKIVQSRETLIFVE